VTDFVVADSLARDAVGAVGDELDLLLLPSLAVSKSNEHAWSPGTLWLSATTLLAVLRRHCPLVATTSIRKLVFLKRAWREQRLAAGGRARHPARPRIADLRHAPVGAPDQGGESPVAELVWAYTPASRRRGDAAPAPGPGPLDLGVRSVPSHLAEFERVRFGGAVSFGWTSDDFARTHARHPTGRRREHGKQRYGRW